MSPQKQFIEMKQMYLWMEYRVSENEKKRVMKEDFNIAMTEKLESEVSVMCNLSQEIWDNAKLEQAIEMAIKLIALGKTTLEEIAEVSGLSLEKVKELAENYP